jgi:hypothetical protein
LPVISSIVMLPSVPVALRAQRIHGRANGARDNQYNRISIQYTRISLGFHPIFLKKIMIGTPASAEKRLADLLQAARDQVQAPRLRSMMKSLRAQRVRSACQPIERRTPQNRLTGICFCS